MPRVAGVIAAAAVAERAGCGCSRRIGLEMTTAASTALGELQGLRLARPDAIEVAADVERFVE